MAPAIRVGPVAAAQAVVVGPVAGAVVAAEAVDRHDAAVHGVSGPDRYRLAA